MLSMKRTAAERDGLQLWTHDRALSSLGDSKGSVRRASTELEGEDAERLQAMRSLRRKRTKPEDWMTGTFHLYAISDVVGAGTFGQVSNQRPSCGSFALSQVPIGDLATF